MVDSDATENFMSQKLISRKGLATQRKKDAYDLTVIDGSPLPSEDGRVDTETIPLPIAIQHHHEELTFDIVRMATHDIVLGMPWLKKHNPEIDWTTRVLRFVRCSCVATIQPTHRQRSMVDEKTATREIAASNKDTLMTEVDSTGTSLGQQGQKVRVSEGLHAPSEILENVDTVRETPRHVSHIYTNWRHLFREEATAAALPKHQS